jgi:hypothetical protein
MQPASAAVRAGALGDALAAAPPVPEPVEPAGPAEPSG